MLDIVRRYGLRARLNAATAVMSLAVAVLGGTGWWAVDRAQRDFTTFTQSELPSLLAVNAAREVLRQLMAFDEVDVVMNYAFPDEARRRAEEGLALLARAQTQLTPLMSGSDGAAREAMAALRAYEALVRPVFDKAGSGTLSSVADGKRALEEVDAHLETASQALSTLAKTLDEATRSRVAQIGERNAAGALALAIIAPITALFLLGVMQLSLWSIRSPLARAQQAADAVSRGDLSTTIEDRGRDEVAELMNTLARMQQGLCAMVGAIRDAAAQQSLASSEIADGSMDLSERTERMASELLTSVGALSQLDERMRLSMQGAHAARRHNDEAAQNTEAGHAAMTTLERAMQEINASFTDIAAVTEVVDGIARRTNILALNAGVEAARAGEHGRGFAVVAEEVRSLANRATESAHQITLVIRQALPKVREAVELMQGSTTAMASVLLTVKRAADGAGRIAEEIQQRSLDTAELSEAMKVLENLTQQNAALVEQSAAAAAHLSAQSQRLQSVVSAFKLPPD